MARVFACIVCIGVLGSTLGASALSQATGRELLPDLDQSAPSRLIVQKARTGKRNTYELGFQSAAANVGEGPLIIDGRRVDLRTPAMTADQLIDHDQGPQSVNRNVGRVEFVRSPDHRHWHLLRFMRYELRRADGGRVRVRDRKTGFCLGDRYPVRSRALPARAPRKVYTSRCGLNLVDRLGVREGISVGYGDNYKAFLEGQSIRLNGLRSGRYELVHRVNADRRLRELSYDNNAASALIDLRWRRGKPVLRRLATCPDRDRCDVAPCPGLE